MAKKYDLSKDPELEVNIKNVKNLLKGFPPKQWHDLGIMLNVPKDKLEEFETNYPHEVARWITEVITYWINNCKAEWKVLWEALCDKSIAQENLGRKIRDWYTEKIWSDPRSCNPPTKPYIQLPDVDANSDSDGRLRAVEYKFSDTGLCPPVNQDEVPKMYFRPVPVAKQPHSQHEGIRSHHLNNIRSELNRYFTKVQPHQKKFKTGYEARFGQLYWILSEEDEKEGDVSYFTDTEQESLAFSTHVTCDITRLIREKCYPPNKDHESWLVDPLKFEVDLPAYGELVFVAVISEHSGLFVLHEVYQQQKRGLNTSFDIVQPGRKYDFRIADCCALMISVDDDKVRQIAQKITRSIHRELDGSLRMQLVGNDFHVRFFRHKRQQIYQWKNKEKEKWYLAEYDVDTFQMSDKYLKALKEEISGDTTEPHVWPVEYNGGHRKEIELWSRKIFPEGYSSSHPTTRQYIDPEATGVVRMPRTAERPATTWITAELMKDFDEFVQAAYDITVFLETAPESS